MAPQHRLLAVITCALTLTLTSCSNGPRIADPASIAAAKQAQVPTMQGEALFFDGKIIAEVSLGRGFRPRFNKTYRKSSDSSNGIAQVYELDKDRRRDDEEDLEDDVFLPRMHNSTIPPVALRIRLTNQNPEAVEIEFIECKSYLGNFAVRPERLKLAPNETGQPEPMNSLLGVPAEAIPVTLGLKLNGRLQTETIMLQPIVSKTTPKP